MRPDCGSFTESDSPPFSVAMKRKAFLPTLKAE